MFIGFGLDFNNAWAGKASGGSSSSSMYIFMLPLAFLVASGWGGYTLLKRRASTQAEESKDATRKELYQELGIGKDKPSLVVGVLSKYGSLSGEELSGRLGLNNEETMKVVRELLQKGIISQDITQKPAKFYLASEQY